jgi:DNA-binding transcriptional ArsR family regulator
VADVPDLALTRALLNEKFLRLRPRDRNLLRSIVAFDVFVGPQLLAVFLGLSPATVAASLTALKRAGLVRASDDGRVGITYRVLRDILPASWRHPGPLEALRMAGLLGESNDWAALARRAELYVLAAHLPDAVATFERAGVEAAHCGYLADAARLFTLGANAAKAAARDPKYVPDFSFDDDEFERTAARCHARARAARSKLRR